MPYICVVDKPLSAIAYTHGFLAQAKDEGMTEAEMEAMERFLSMHPDAGDLIVGSGGCRKVRIARAGRGKSGGYRIVTFFTSDDLPLYLIAMLAKGSRANFDDDEVAAMAAFAKRIKDRARRQSSSAARPKTGD